MVAERIARITVVGGGTAGWLSACRIAAAGPGLSVTLVESPDVATIGVGEGTWPTMRATLARIGIDEADFLDRCDASFKQGSRFDGWASGAAGDSYYHPFTAPADVPIHDMIAAWDPRAGDFASFACAQPDVCRDDLAPRQAAMPGYAGALNYGYHLDAAKLAAMLQAHATTRLGVTHIRDHVTGVRAAANGDVAAVVTRDHGELTGDLFLDCTGHAALLIGGHCGVPLIDRTSVLFNDRALAVQVPVAPDSGIASQTNATAHDAGWIWDIGLPHRRGVGCVYASDFLTDDQAAATLTAYLARTAPGVDPATLSFRQLRFRSGHRTRFWQGNVLAIGLSAGFLEPLEASAIVLIELSLDALLDGFPADRAAMDLHARRFDARFRYRWDRIVDFLKLHYVPSRREQPYWRAHRDPASIPESLRELLALWRTQPPTPADLAHAHEIFPAASYQYVLYGMGAAPPREGMLRTADVTPALADVRRRARSLAAHLPTNRACLRATRAPAENRHARP